MEFEESKSYKIARKFIGKKVKVIIDKPLGSKHKKFQYKYEVNYGFIPNTMSPDNEELDAYYLSTDKPLDKAEGIAIAVMHRTDDDDDKLVVVAEGENPTDEEIMKKVYFQEKYFHSSVLRK